MQLAPCPRCGRHLRVAETECPWCAAATPELTPKRPRRVKNLTRAAIVYLGAALATPGCGATDEPDGEETPEAVDQPYGAPPPPEDDEVDLPPREEDPPEEDEPIAQPYGAPPVEEINEDADESVTDSFPDIRSAAQPYGASPMPEDEGIDFE